MISFPSIKKINSEDENYPPLLKETYGYPKTLYSLGTLDIGKETAVAIVGTRKATPEGKLFAKQIAKELASRGIIIVSGLALGIDAAAHEGALAGNGKTIAVLANGLDTIYPQQHYNLALKIVEKNGAIISEYPAGAPALKHHFLERNRIVSGLSIATIVIEAPIHSGSLVTARLAIEAGRDVLVAPGPIRHQNYKGSHLLIRNGARLITNVEDILEDLQSVLPFPETKNNKINNITDARQLSIVQAIQNNNIETTVDNIIELTKLESHIVNQTLSFLVLDGIIKEQNGKFVINS